MLAAHDGRRRAIHAADAAARRLGLHPGLPLAEARARVPGLHVGDADPAADATGLERLALWCLRRYSPVVAVDPPEGLWIDATGAGHLFGGDEAMLADMIRRLARAGIRAHAAMAETPGAAHALARYGNERLDRLRWASCRRRWPRCRWRRCACPPEMVAELRRLGFERIGELERRRAALAGAALRAAAGPAPRPGLRPPARAAGADRPARDPSVERSFAEPISAPETLQRYIGHAGAPALRRPSRPRHWAPGISICCSIASMRVVQGLRIGTSAPSRDARHLGRHALRAAGERSIRGSASSGWCCRPRWPSLSRIASWRPWRRAGRRPSCRRWSTRWPTGWGPSGCSAPRRTRATCPSARSAASRRWPPPTGRSWPERAAAPQPAARSAGAGRHPGAAARPSAGPVHLARRPAPGRPRRRPRAPARRMVGSRERGRRPARLFPRRGRHRRTLLAVPRWRRHRPAWRLDCAGTCTASSHELTPSCRSRRISRSCAAPPAARSCSPRPPCSACRRSASPTGIRWPASSGRTRRPRPPACGWWSAAGSISTDGMAVLVYPTDRPAYARLCRLLTLGKAPRRQGRLRPRLGRSRRPMAKACSPCSCPTSRTRSAPPSWPGCGPSSATGPIWR